VTGLQAPGAAAPGSAGAPPPPGPGWGWKAVCAAEALREGGDGVRFEVPSPGAPDVPAFVVRFRGVPRAYVNRCSHVPVELDWQEGRFFDDTGLYLICSTHGALYAAEDGACAGGPCRGRPLATLQACESAGTVWVAIRTGEI
jgi:nitrite reductase/ring-hydroxylating ferredoxin subunit